ncbi:MAG: sel1 repeat family protein [Deltaproteobacteria bacterium]|nr:MAG: sel1 repeat family protein [Deltaproteobacteria bacterium]
MTRLTDRFVPLKRFTPLSLLIGATLLGGSLLPSVAEARPRALRWYQSAEAHRLGQKGKKANLKQATKLHKRACSRRYGRSCWRLGQMNPASEDSVTYMKKACRYKFGDGCLALARNLAKSSLKASKRKAHRMFRKACKLGSGQGCLEVYQLATKAFAAKKTQSPQAKKRWQRKQLTRRARFALLLRKGCQQGHESDCFYLGYAHFQGILQRDLNRARTSFLRGCKLQHPNSCDFVALMYGNGIGVQQDFKKARDLHLRACKLGLNDGCLHAGGMFLRGLGGMKDASQARKLFSQTCEANIGQACLLLGEMVIRGEGGSKDVKLAYRLYEKACRLKSKEGCLRFKAMKRILYNKPKRQLRRGFP